MPQGSPLDKLVPVEGWAGDEEGFKGLTTAGRSPLEVPPDRLLEAKDIEINEQGTIRLRYPVRPWGVVPDAPLTAWKTMPPVEQAVWMIGANFTPSLILLGRNTSGNRLYAAAMSVTSTDSGEGAFPPNRVLLAKTSPPDPESDLVVAAWPGKVYVAPTQSRTPWNAPVWAVTLGAAALNIDLLADPAASGWSEDFDTPTVGRFPTSSVLYRLDQGGTSYMLAADGSVIRWSHPSSRDYSRGSEAWREGDYTQVGATAGDRITAIAHFRDLVLVFKRKEIWALRGSFPGAVITTLLASGLGTPAQRTVAVSEHGVWFCDQPGGVFLWDGSRVVPFTQQLGELGTLAPTSRYLSLGYQGQRVFLSGVKDPAGSGNWGTLVLDLRSRTWVYHSYAARGVLPATATVGIYDSLAIGYGSVQASEKSTTDRGSLRSHAVFRVPETYRPRVDGTERGESDVYAYSDVDAKTPDSTQVVNWTARFQTGYARAERPDMIPRWRHLDVDEDSKGLGRRHFVVVDGGEAQEHDPEEPAEQRPGYGRRLSFGMKFPSAGDRTLNCYGVTFRYWETRRRPS